MYNAPALSNPKRIDFLENLPFPLSKKQPISQSNEADGYACWKNSSKAFRS